MDYYDDYYDDYDDYDDTSDFESDVDDEEDALYRGFVPTHKTVAKQKEEFDVLFAPFQVSFKNLNNDYSSIENVNNNIIYNINNTNNVKLKSNPNNNNNVSNIKCFKQQQFTSFSNEPPPKFPTCNFNISGLQINNNQNNNTALSQKNMEPTTQEMATNKTIPPTQNININKLYNKSQANMRTQNVNNKKANKNSPTIPPFTASNINNNNNRRVSHINTLIQSNETNNKQTQQNVLNQCHNTPLTHSDPISACATPLPQHTTTTNSNDVKYSTSIKPFKYSFHTTLSTPTPITPILTSSTQSIHIDKTLYVTENKRSKNKNNNNLQPQRDTPNTSNNRHWTTYNLIGITFMFFALTFMFFALILMNTFIFHAHFGFELLSKGRERDKLHFGKQNDALYCRDHSVVDQEYEKKYQCYELNRHGIRKNSTKNAFVMSYQSHVSNRHGIGIIGITSAVRSVRIQTNYHISKVIDESFIFYFKKSIVYLSIFDIVKVVEQTLTPTKYLNKIVGGLGDSASAPIHLLQRSYLSIGLYFFGGFGFLSHPFYCLINYLAGVFTMLVVALLNHYYV